MNDSINENVNNYTNVECPECKHKPLKYMARYECADIFHCEKCLSDWKVYFNEGNKIERHFWG